GDQSVRRIYMQIAALRQSSLVTGSLYSSPAQSIRFLGPDTQLFLDGQRDLQCHWCDNLQQQFTDGLIDAGTGNHLADWLCLLGLFTLAEIAWHETFGLLVIPNRHSAPAHSAHHQTLKQGRPFTGRTVAPVSTMSLSALAQPPDVLLILLPGDITWIGV